MADTQEVDYMSLIDAEMSRLKSLLRVTERERDAARDSTIAFVVGDLRQAAESYTKSAAIASKRIERKHLTAIASVLNERASYYAHSQITASAEGVEG
jgi:hypothetical protein